MKFLNNRIFTEMLILAASPDVNIQKFIELIHQSSCSFVIQSFAEWQHTNIIPQGFIYIQVAPAISFKRLIKINPSITLNDTQGSFELLHNYFATKTIMPSELHEIPTLTLNGFVDFETDFSQFYNHLFYIKKFFNEIKEKENKEKGIFVPKKHTGCKC